MLDDLQLVEESELPAFTDGKMIDFARELGEEFMLQRDMRSQLETEIWPACDRAFACIRDDLSRAIPTMHLIDNGMLGESDVREAIKAMRNQVLDDLLPPDESWLKPIALNDEDDEDTLQKVQDHLIDLHRKAGMREACEPFADQLFVRGTSSLGVRWDTIMKAQRLNPMLRKTLKEAGARLANNDANKEAIKAINKQKMWVPVYSGPKVYPIDMYRLYLDATSEIGLDTDIATIYVMFKSLSDLKNARDEEGEHLYDQKAIEAISPWDYKDYYKENPDACASTKLLGIDPTLTGFERTGEKFIPIYVFHSLVRCTKDGDQYVDKFFYVARSNASDSWRIVRVQDNPSDAGDSPYFVALCDRWLNVPYGAGLAEKSISAWKAKNFYAALGPNALMLAAFPPVATVAGSLKDDRKIKWGPLANNEVIYKAGVGKDWITPLPININAPMLGQQQERGQAQKIVSQIGSSMAPLLSDPSKSMSKSKTATEVRQESMDGGMAKQVLVTRLSQNIIQQVAQCVYNWSRQKHGVGGSDGASYIARRQGDPSRGEITGEAIDRDRLIEIVGRRGLANKRDEINNLMEVLKILSNPQAAQIISNLPMILQDVIFKLVARLGVPLKPEYRVPEEQLLAQSPKAQIAALQMALQNPELREQIAQELLSSPEGQQFVAAIHAEAKATAEQPKPKSGAA